MAVISNIMLLGAYRYAAQLYWPSFEKEYRGEILPHLILAAGTTWIAHAIGIIFYCGIEHYGLFEDYKICKTVLRDVDPKGWRRLRNRAIWYNFLNTYIINTMLIYLAAWIGGINNDSYSLEIPSIGKMAGHLYFCVFMEAALFFVMHVIGHKYMYRWHKLHHEFKIPHVLNAMHLDPIDYLVGTALPFAGGYILLGDNVHFITLTYWSVWRLCEGASNHSNYDFDWSMFRIVPAAAGASYHTFHHTHNIGNYGSFMALHDTICGTNKDYYKFIQSGYID
jgi:sterol desaturase/sphingolipid hydroxylase (fatty acid hydroxylase superfamily)